jgi:hypothetical protein
MHELAQQQRVAARLLLAGSAERILGIRRERLAYQPGRGVGTQGSGPDHGCERVGDDLANQRLVLARIRLSQANDQRHVEPLHPRQQVREPAQRRQIAPLQVIDCEQQRPAAGDVRRKPVETVQCRQ